MNTYSVWFIENLTNKTTLVHSGLTKEQADKMADDYYTFAIEEPNGRYVSVAGNEPPVVIIS